MLNTLTAWLSLLASNLFNSMTSASFYSKVYQEYSGSGLKYLTMIALLSAFIFSTSLLYVTTEFNNYFSKGITSSRTSNLDHLLGQFPTLNYDGNKITTESESPVFLYNSKNRKIVVIDLANKTKPHEIKNIPVHLSSHKFTFSVNWPLNGEQISAPIQYSAILGAKPLTIDQEYVRNLLEETFANSSRSVIYAVFPMASMSFFIGSVTQNIMTIIFLVILSFMQNGKFLIAKNLRVVIFACAPIMLFQTIANTLTMFAVLNPIATTYVKYIQIWTNLLMIIGIFQSLRKNKIKILK